jgi:hypothetical protein
MNKKKIWQVVKRKYDIGDYVYIMDGGSVKKGVVISISVNTDALGYQYKDGVQKADLIYRIAIDGYSREESQEFVFESLDDLFNTLKAEKKETDISIEKV